MALQLDGRLRLGYDCFHHPDAYDHAAAGHQKPQEHDENAGDTSNVNVLSYE